MRIRVPIAENQPLVVNMIAAPTSTVPIDMMRSFADHVLLNDDCIYVLFAGSSAG